MSAWRRRAIAAFPELRKEFGEKDHTIHELYFDLLPLTEDALTRQDEAFCSRAFAFSEWCLAQPNELSNAAGVSFYEHLLDKELLWGAVAAWIPPAIFRQVEGLFVARLGGATVERFKKVYARRTSGKEKRRAPR